jgi:glycine betaine/proline transport system ATP-binding protein
MERVAMVFQQFALLPWRTVRENVGFGLELRGVTERDRRRTVEEKLHLVGLEQWADRYAHELSGGMQQRVGLARAFATDADILLMDEPFSALDPLIRTKLQDELLVLQATVRKTILFVSHDLDEALKIGNRISILEGGRIVQTGTPEDIVLRPADDYVAEFVKHMNPLSVLKGVSVMRPLAELARETGGVWLDDERIWHVTLDDEQRPLLARRNGVTYPVVATASDDDARPPGATVAFVDQETSLRHIMKLRHETGYPVLLSAAGRLVGTCAEFEILHGLCGGERNGTRDAAAA